MTYSIRLKLIKYKIANLFAIIMMLREMCRGMLQAFRQSSFRLIDF